MAIVDVRQVKPGYASAIAGGNMRRNFSGVHVDILGGVSGQTINSGTSADLIWERANYDVGGWFDSGSPTILTVPAGVTRVRHSCGVEFFAFWGGSDDVQFLPRLNGVTNNPAGILEYQLTVIFSTWTYTSPSYPVTPGDTIALRAFAVNITPPNFVMVEGAQTYLAVEAVQ